MFKRSPAIIVAALILAMLASILPPPAANAGLITTAGVRYHSSAPDPDPPTGDWADVKITNVSAIGSALMTDGQTVGITVGASFTGLSQQLTSGNGATMDVVAGDSFDGQENTVRIFPPTVLVGGEGQYASWLRNLDIWNNASHDIAQLNVRWLQYNGPRYFDLASTAKISGVFAQDSFTPAGGAKRQAVWEAQDAQNWSPYKYWGTTSNSTQYYPGGGIDTFPDSQKLLQLAGAPSHALNPPRIGDEWVCLEQVVDLRQDRGNANGMNKLMLHTRDGVVNGRFIQAVANWDQGAIPWSFTYRYISGFEGLGFYFNRAGTANAGNYVKFSHVTFAANMGINERIGCENIPGFIQ